MPDPNVEALLAYLRQNSGRFSLEALELQMHAAGHTPATVRAALARFLAAGPSAGRRPGDDSAASPAAVPAPTAGPGIPPPASAASPLPASSTVPPPPSSADPHPPGTALRRPAWGAAAGVAAFDLILAAAGYGLIKMGEGKVAWMGGCVLILLPLGLLLELLVGLVLTASDGASRAGRAMLYGSLLVLGLAALALVGAGLYLALHTKSS